MTTAEPAPSVRTETLLAELCELATARGMAIVGGETIQHEGGPLTLIQHVFAEQLLTLLRDLRAAAETITRLERALGYYADASNWDCEGRIGISSSWYDAYSGATEYDFEPDDGDVARAALAGSGQEGTDGGH